jgi:hypothetical protein
MPYADIEKRRRHHREYQKSPQGKAAHARAISAWRARNRKKLAAHNAISKAILRGIMVKPDFCAMPDCDCKDVEAHHPDYDAPLDVVWLCHAHHRQTHEMAKNETR